MEAGPWGLQRPFHHFFYRLWNVHMYVLPQRYPSKLTGEKIRLVRIDSYLLGSFERKLACVTHGIMSSLPSCRITYRAIAALHDAVDLLANACLLDVACQQL